MYEENLVKVFCPKSNCKYHTNRESRCGRNIICLTNEDSTGCSYYTKKECKHAYKCTKCGKEVETTCDC